MNETIGYRVSSTFRRIISLSRTKTARNSLIVFSGNLLTATLGFLSIVIITRVLGPYDFGLFSVALAVMTMVVGLADLGIGTGLVRFASLYLEKDRGKADVLFKVVFNLELLISGLILVLGLIFARPLAILISGKSELVFPLRLAFLGAAALSMGSYIVAVLQAWQSFIKLSLYSVITNVVKVSLIVTLLFLHYFHLISVMTVYAVVPFIGITLGMTLIPKDFFRKKHQINAKSIFLELFHFSKWVMISYLANTVISRIDVLILSRYKGAEAVGIYSAGYQLSMIFPLLIGSIATVLLPKVSRLTEKQQFLSFIKKTLLMSCLIIVVLFPGFIFTRELVGLFFGTKYLAAAGIFRVLFLAFMVNLIFNPISTVIYALNKPAVFTVANLIQLVLCLVGNFVLIPIYGGYGAAYTFLGHTLIGATIVATYLTWQLVTMPMTEELG